MKKMNIASHHTDRKQRCLATLLVAFTTVTVAFQAAAQADATNTTATAQPSSTNTQTNAIPAASAPSTNAVPVASAAPAIGPESSKGGFGIGAILGEPTGLSLKCWLNDTKAIDAGVAYSFESRSSLHLHSDFLFHNFDLLPVSSGQLPFYYGVGGRVKLERHEDTRAGVRAPVGLAYMFERAPVDIFVEVAPILDLHPRTKFAINGGIGVRYYFR